MATKGQSWWPVQVFLFLQTFPIGLSPVSESVKVVHRDRPANAVNKPHRAEHCKRKVCRNPLLCKRADSAPSPVIQNGATQGRLTIGRARCTRFSWRSMLRCILSCSTSARARSSGDMRLQMRADFSAASRASIGKLHRFMGSSVTRAVTIRQSQK